ncbi:QacE family quaternary ammonium compound efflux SMR transporter [Ferrimonas sediminicola]|uniref:QacE family quaternary ammonium compound efflux SMR transporter n=2 Tax=Ferrimonas sediminicola TaxID=2569538 RepID=A0A4U1BHK0_9GAMM|nr:QacE family quaternary ammonium compound efflux SMR transporter [Ferrimonas sediminicola]
MLAILAEVGATSLLGQTRGFTRLLPTLLCLGGYLVAFALLARVVTQVPVGIAYALWCGSGMVLVALAAWLLRGERLDGPALVGIGLILAGTLVIRLFSSVSAH